MIPEKYLAYTLIKTGRLNKKNIINMYIHLRIRRKGRHRGESDNMFSERISTSTLYRVAQKK